MIKSGDKMLVRFQVKAIISLDNFNMICETDAGIKEKYCRLNKNI